MEDVKIVQLYWDRDPNAITKSATKYGDYCTSIAKNILGNKEDVEELKEHIRKAIENGEYPENLWG